MCMQEAKKLSGGGPVLLSPSRTNFVVTAISARRSPCRRVGCDSGMPRVPSDSSAPESVT